MLLPATEATEAFLVFDRLREQFERMTFQCDETTFLCTFSTGIVEVLDPTKPIGHWIELADSALYEAKIQEETASCLRNNKKHRIAEL